VLDDLTREYYRPLKRKQLVNSSLAAMVASLGDPYSHYYSPSNYNRFQQATSPHVSGIGVDVQPQPRGLLVLEVFPGTPADRAGLRPGDLIVSVDGRSLVGRSENASSLITGRQGTAVTLGFERAGASHTITLRRANVLVVSGGIVDYHGTPLGVARLTQFSEGSAITLRVKIDSLLHQGARGLILDLRDNGGGLVDEAVAVASIFIPDGTIVSTAGRSQPRQVYLARGGAISTSVPVVVLVDGGTASAAEIVTGALQDRGRAKVVGTHTYGKGVFQEIQPLSNGGALDITVGEYFTPSGRNLGGGGVRQGAGVEPNVHALDNPHTPRDEALAVAERVLAGEIQ
jgi:carboxyl-terminal processing protease